MKIVATLIILATVCITQTGCVDGKTGKFFICGVTGPCK